MVRALNDLLAGARNAHDLAEMLVEEAVQRTLAHVTTDYPLDYTRLLDKYQPEVVRECCAMFEGADADAPRCFGTTKAGKPCARRAVLNGVCAKHVDAWKQQQAAQRRQQVYDATRRGGPVDPYAQELAVMSKKRQVSMAFPDDVPHML